MTKRRNRASKMKNLTIKDNKVFVNGKEQKQKPPHAGKYYQGKQHKGTKPSACSSSGAKKVLKSRKSF